MTLLITWYFDILHCGTYALSRSQRTRSLLQQFINIMLITWIVLATSISTFISIFMYRSRTFPPLLQSTPTKTVFNKIQTVIIMGSIVDLILQILLFIIVTILFVFILSSGITYSSKNQLSLRATLKYMTTQGWNELNYINGENPMPKVCNKYPYTLILIFIIATSFLSYMHFLIIFGFPQYTSNILIRIIFYCINLCGISAAIMAFNILYLSVTSNTKYHD